MSRMLEAYLAFARGDAAEHPPRPTWRALLEELHADAQRHGHATKVSFRGDPIATRAARRLQALPGQPRLERRSASATASSSPARGEVRYLTVRVDDDGPGVPEDKRDDGLPAVPSARRGRRNQDLELAVTRDLAPWRRRRPATSPARHGGDVILPGAREPASAALRATVRVPL